MPTPESRGAIPPPPTRAVAPALLIAVVAVSFAAIFFRKAAPTPPLVAAGIRLAMASFVLLPFTTRSALTGRLRGTLLRSAILAGTLYGVHFGAWVTSLTRTTVAASVTLVTTTPLLLALLGVFTGKDRPDRRLWGALALAAAGLVLIGGRDLAAGGGALLGDGLAVLGAVAMAGYLLVGRRLGMAMDLPAFSGVATGVGATLLLGAAFLLGIPIRPASREALIFLVLAALVPQLVGHNLLTWALRRAKPATVGMAIVGEPVGATILAALWLGERVAPLAAVGCAATLAGVVWAAMGSVREPARARHVDRAGPFR